MRFVMVVVVLVGMSAAADTEIHRCLLDDGTFAFQQSPCAVPTKAADNAGEPAEKDRDDAAGVAVDGAFDFVNPFDEAADPTPAVEPALPEPPSRNRAECEKTTRDAIDAIDLEMRETSYTREQGQAYREELLVLTRQLRACKQL